MAAGTSERVKFSAQLFAFALWITSWFPSAPDRWAILVGSVCGLGVLAAVLAQKRRLERPWPKAALRGSAILVLIGGSLLAFGAWALGTSADGAIALFFALGFAGYLHLLALMLSPANTSSRFDSAGWLVVMLMATWSWGSALAMYVHRGAAGTPDEACILVPTPLGYETELTSLWEMRLPEIVTSRTGPTGSHILDYHAILVRPFDDQPEVYNWSKRRMRFELLDRKRNPYLPTSCP